jgi:hypothetical protein
MDEKGILPVLVGGLGNQMFIITASFILSKVKRCPLYISKTHTHNNPHNIFQIDYKKNIFKYFGTHLDSSEDELLSIAKKEKYVQFSPQGFYPWKPEDCNPGSIMSSYFQYYPPFAPFEKEIRSLYLQGLADFLPSIQNQKTTAFLHIRRGDYVLIPHVHYNQPISYYEKGVELLLKKNSSIHQFLVFSDDIEWVKQQPFFLSNSLFTFIDEPHELKSLALMSQCKGGAVCANSTFSWWGAFLGAYEERNPVIVPKKWICDPVYELFPPEWIVLD